MKNIVASLFLFFSVFALAKTESGIKGVIHFLNNQQIQKDVAKQREETEMKSLPPLSQSDFCCERNRKDGEFNNDWSPQEIAAFVNSDKKQPSLGTPSDSTGAE